MGWDAYATKDGKGLELYLGAFNRIKDDDLRVIFYDAQVNVKLKADVVDGFLRTGGLDCSDCANALEQATGMNCYGEDLLSSDVKVYHLLARWENVDESVPKWAKESAKEFLRVCAENDLGIRFSY